MKTNTKGLVYGLALATLLGLSGTAWGQHGGHGNKDMSHGGHGKARKETGSNFQNRVYRVTEADSLQRIKMKPALDKAAKRLEALRASYQKQEKRVMDSLSVQLKPILKDEQVKRWEDYLYHQGQRKK